MQLPRVIGLSGLKQSGKNTLASALEAHGYTTVAYADPLRKLCLDLDPYVATVGNGGMVRLSEVIDRYGWDVAKERFPEVRRIMQFLGTEVVRAVKPDHWIEQMQSVICDTDQKFVVADIRFENEADLVRQCGGIVVEVHRPGRIAPVDAHISEAGVVADWVVVNSGSREDLFREFMREIGDL